MSRDAPNPPSVYSAEGTAYHKLAEETLRYGRLCVDRAPQIFEVDGFKITITPEDALHAQTYVDAIKALPGEKHYEVQLDTSELLGVPEQGGTADCVSLDFEHATIHVDDLKFGRGEVVYAENNEQLLLYGAAALRRYDLLGDWKYVRVAIHQPRVSHYSEHIYTRLEIETAVAAMREPAQLAKQLYDGASDPLASLNPGEKQCRWCPVRGSCPARARKILDMFPIVPVTPEVPLTRMTISRLSNDLLALARERVEEIEQWCSDIRKEAEQRALTGQNLPGWKLVAGRPGNRKWAEAKLGDIEAALILALGEDKAFQKREIVSPTGAEALLKKSHPEQWAALQAVIERAPGKQTLVREKLVSDVVTPVQIPEFGLVNNASDLV